jgi:bacillithiol system protein YtxJ
MSFFKSILGSNEENRPKPSMTWRQLTDLGQLNEIIHQSTEVPVVIFKHSTRCSISKMALKQFENDFDTSYNVIPYYLDLLKHRDVSNAIAQRFDVPHQSPQIIVIKDGVAIYHASHESVSAKNLLDF